MYAIIDVAGQQFKVEKGQKIYVHRLENEEGSDINLDRVLLIDDEGKITIGEPLIDGAFVEGKVLTHLKGDKVIVFKKKRRKGYKVKNGHRQQFSQLEILKINEKGAPKKTAEKAKPAVKAETSAKTETKVEKKAAPKAEVKKKAAPKAETKAKAEVKEEKKPAAKKPAAKKPAAKKPAAKKPAAKKPAAKKPAAKKAAPSTSAKATADKKGTTAKKTTTAKPKAAPKKKADGDAKK